MPKNEPTDTPTKLRRQTPGVGRTERTREGRAEPRLPAERDESADSQDSEGATAAQPLARDVGEQAFKDLDAGQQDTDRAPLTDKVYDRLKDDKA